jgi:gluconate kinase
MEPEMLKSQFDILEEPTNAFTVDVSGAMDDIVQEIISNFLP